MEMSRSPVSANRYRVRNRCSGAGFRGVATGALLMTTFGAATVDALAWSERADGPLRSARVDSTCQAGQEACPAILRMKPGAHVVMATGSVSGEHPDDYFRFYARAGQEATIRVVGGNIKTGPGIPITFPNGRSDAVDEGRPFTLPATGTYVFVLHANTMSEGPFGRFQMTLRID